MGVAHAQVRAAAHHAQHDLADGDAGRIRGGVAEHELHVLHELARFERDPRSVGHLARARAHEVDGVRIVGDALERERAAGVAVGLAHARLSVRAECVQHDAHVGCGIGAGRMHDPAPDGRQPGRDVGRRVTRKGLRGRRGGEERRERTGVGERSGSHPVRRSGVRRGWGHITRIVPSTKIPPPIQIQLTSGLR